MNPDLLRSEFLGVTVRYDDVEFARDDLAMFFSEVSSVYDLPRFEFNPDGAKRFEEITRCPPEIQDTLVSILSEKQLMIPELGEEKRVSARPGFNVIATANLRDRGVHEMSAALKRRFNFETVRPIADRAFEAELIAQALASRLRSVPTMPLPTMTMSKSNFRRAVAMLNRFQRGVRRGPAAARAQPHPRSSARARTWRAAARRRPGYRERAGSAAHPTASRRDARDHR